MQYAVLGPSGIRVSRLCMGTMLFGNPLDEAPSRRLVDHCLASGLNFFDTSNAYEGYDRTFGSRGGVSEEVLGKALKGKRHRAIICTKFANPVGLGPEEGGLSVRHLEAELDASLKRLGTDWVDLFLAHRWEATASVPEVWRLFDRWVQAGKVRAVGISNWPVWRIAQAAELGQRHGWPAVSASSPKYSLLCRGIEMEHMTCARHYGISLLTYQALEGGRLSGKYRRNQPLPEASRAVEWPNATSSMEGAFFDQLEALERLAQEAGMDLVQYVTAWTLGRPGVASLIIGSRDEKQLNGTFEALDKTIPAEHLPQIDALFPPPRPLGGEQVLFWREKRGWVLEDREV